MKKFFLPLIASIFLLVGVASAAVHIFINSSGSTASTLETITSVMITIVNFKYPEAGNCVDGNVETDGFYGDNAGVGSYVRVDFGANKDVVKWKAYAHHVNTHINFKIQYSDDASAWTDASANCEMNGSIGWKEITWSSVGAHRYWQMYKNDAATPGGACSEIEAYVAA